MTSIRRTTAITVAVVVLLIGLNARAQERVGSVAALEGSAEAPHPGTTDWVSLENGGPIVLGDQLRTGPEGKLKLLFRDDSVLTLGPSSTLTLDEQVAGGPPSSRFTLAVGTLRAIVTERYGAAGARFEVSTPTAIAGVHGTGFIASFDDKDDKTTVVGLFDTTLVRPAGTAPGAHEVRLAPGQGTTVHRGAFPMQPSRLPENVIRSLSGATTLAAGGVRGPGGPGSGNGQPNAKHPRQNAASQQQVVDQPVSILNKTGAAGGLAPPPPPPPHPAP